MDSRDGGVIAELQILRCAIIRVAMPIAIAGDYREDFATHRTMLPALLHAGAAACGKTYPIMPGKTCPPRPQCRSRQDAAGQGVFMPAGGGRRGHFWRTDPD